MIIAEPRIGWMRSLDAQVLPRLPICLLWCSRRERRIRRPGMQQQTASSGKQGRDNGTVARVQRDAGPVGHAAVCWSND